MIGLLDYDALANQAVKYPNLELMKMATYLCRTKKSYRIVLDPDDLTIYSQVMVFQEDASLGFPTSAFRKRNTEYYGLAFTGGKYKKLKQEIEDCAPDISVYKQLFKQFLLNDTMEPREIGYLLNASYVRLALPLNRRYIRTIKKNRRVIVYDDEAFVNDWETNVDALLKRDITGFKFINEQRVKDIELWKKIFTKYERRNFNYNPISLDADFDLSNMPAILEVYKKLQGDNKSPIGVGTNAIIYINIPPPYKENTAKFGEAIGLQMEQGLTINWRQTPYIGNPYHSFITALSDWARGQAFFEYSFLQFLLKYDLHRQRRYALKLIKKNKKYSLIFNARTLDVRDAMGGLKSYESRRNYRSIYSDYLTL